MSYKLDLHTHSYGSPDGSLSAKAYRQMFERGSLDYVAITDHNTVEAALDVQKSLDELGQRIIIGEEITTTEGEIIGLFLKQTIPSGTTPEEAIEHIRKQGGLVYVPHPFETVRSGMTTETLQRIAHSIDIIEICNGRAVFQDRSKLAKQFGEQHDLAGDASSDAHGACGWGRTYSTIEEVPTRENLVGLLRVASFQEGKVGLGILHPKLNRARRFLGL